MEIPNNFQNYPVPQLQQIPISALLTFPNAGQAKFSQNRKNRMVALVFIHPVKADGSLGIRSCPAKSLSEAISLVIGLTCKWSICVYDSESCIDSGWNYRIDSERNTHGTRGIVTWQNDNELNVFLPNYDSSTVWADLREIEKRFRHNVRAFVQRQRQKTGLPNASILASDHVFRRCLAKG